MRIPLVEEEDQLIWLKSNDGMYSVEAEYKVARAEGRKEEVERPSTSHRVSKKLWNGIWNIKMPPKVNQFLWRTLNNALATKDALYNKKCSRMPSCSICKSQVENVEYALFLCPWANLCWFGSPLSLKFDGFNMSRLDLWLEKWMFGGNEIDDHNLALFAGLCWNIWKERCSFVFEGADVNAAECLTKAIRLVNEYTGWLEKRKRREAPTANIKRDLIWHKPVKDCIKINIDGAYCSKSMQAGIGLVGRDCEGRFMGGLGLSVEAESAFMAECLALLEALRVRDIFTGGQVVIETDCQELYRRVTQKEVLGCDWRCRDVLKECLELGGSDSCWSMSLVSRKGNKAADWVAARIMRGMVPKGWLDKPPPPLKEVLLQDLNSNDVSVDLRTGIG